ncbi:MAG TPA: HAMP domain-containing sensor histidine kinase [Polyangia bacterium]
MSELLTRWFGQGFMPHGHCYLWTPSMVVTQATSNTLIGLAYMVIAAALVYLVRRVQDVPFRWMYLAFGVFIVTCGCTHLLDTWTIWTPVYWLDAGVRVITAIASVGTAVLLFPLIPKAIALGDAAAVAHTRGVQLEQVNRELALLYERTRETLAEAIPQLVFTGTPAGQIDYFNARWQEYAGADAGSAGRLAAAVHPDDAAALEGRRAACLASGEPFAIEVRLRRRDGAYRWHLARALPLRDEGGRIVKWFGTATDIDDQKRVAEERERLLLETRATLQSRDVFLAVAAHELKTPLTPLRLQVELLQRQLAGATPAPGRTGEQLAVTLRQVDRLETLVHGLLDVSRLAAGRLELELEELDLAALVREVVERHRGEVERSGASVVVHAATPTPGRWDRMRLEQVVTNLLTNALKFCDRKPIEVEVSADADRARVRVRDHGPGIPPEDQARIFGRFERAASPRHYAGLGLGLWIASQLVTALGGRIHLASAPGAGATFTVELPRTPPAPG